MSSTKQRKKVEVQKGIPQLSGVFKVGAGYNFSATFEKCKEVSLLLYQKGKKRIYAEIPLTEEYRTGNVLSVWISGLESLELEYQYKVDGRVTVDPCAKAVTGRNRFGDAEEVRAERGMRGIVCGDQYQISCVPRKYVPYHDMILYKLHVRGFTNSRTSNVSKRGTFAGLKEKIPYLTELGVTSVEIMPAYDFNELPGMQRKVNFWGYTGGFYFAPKAAYCAGKDSILEFQDCVDAFHEAGLEFLMEFYFDRQMSALRILEILRHWVSFYHVDGFHLVGEQIPVDLILQDDVLKDVKILYERFDEQQIAYGKNQEKKYLAEYHQGFMRTVRCFLKGDRGQSSGFIWCNRRNPEKIGTINYLTNQDGFTLADLVSYGERHNDANGEENRDGSSENYSWNCGVEGETRKTMVLELRKKQMRNAILFMMLSQGTPMLYAGDEFGNSQQGNNNAWCQDNVTGWVDWSLFKRNHELYEFVKDAIAFRKNHPIFHLDREIRETDYLALGYPEISYHSDKTWLIDLDDRCRSIGIMYCGKYADDDDIYIAYNMDWRERKFGLPLLPKTMKWYQAEENGFYEELQPIEGAKEIIVPPRTIAILIGK